MAKAFITLYILSNFFLNPHHTKGLNTLALNVLEHVLSIFRVAVFVAKSETKALMLMTEESIVDRDSPNIS